MKKRGFLIYLILGFLFFPSFVFARNYSGVATTARSAVLDTSSNYYYTNWIVLQSNSLNSVPIPYGGGNYYHMGAEYVMPLSLNGESQFEAYVRVPVVSNTIYNYQLMNGLNFDDFKIGFSGTFGVYNVSSFLDWDSSWECQTYPHLGVAHNYCYYDIYVKFNMTPITGGTNMNFAVFNTNASHSSYYYTGYDSNGNALEFPVASQNSGYPTLSPTVRLIGSGGDSGGTTDNSDITNSIDENSQLIIDSLNDNSEQVIEQINENYQNLVNSQLVCDSVSSTSTILNSDSALYFNGTVVSVSGASVSSFIPLSFSSSIVLNGVYGNGGGYFACFYTSSQSFISCFQQNTYSVGSTIPIPDNASFIRFTFNTNSHLPSFSVNSCKNGNQAISDQIDGLLDHNTDDIDFTFGDIDSISDTPVSDLLLLPIEILTRLSQFLNSSCTSWDLPFNLWGTSNYVLHLPCLNLEDYLGSTLWTLIDDLFCVLMLYNIFKMLLRFFESWSSLNDTFDSVVGGVK